MFHFSPRNALLPSAALVALLGLSACGGGDSDPAPADSTTAITASGAAAGAAAGTVTTTTTPPPVTPPPAAGPLSITGLTDFRSTTPNTLVNFAAATPNTVVAKAITGLTAGDIVVGIDVRPSDGVMWAFARAAVANGDPTGAASIYVINPDTGVASGRVAVTGVTFDSATSVSVDFNPAVDRMRVITFFGQSVAINVVGGAATQNGAIQGTTFAAAVAYTNSAVSPTAPASTVLYRIDNQGAPDDLTTITPATGAIATTAGPIGLALTEVQAFDITGVNNVNALAALRTTASGAHSLYRINLATGAAGLFNSTAALSLIGGTAGVPLVDIAIRP